MTYLYEALPVSSEIYDKVKIGDTWEADLRFQIGGLSPQPLGVVINGMHDDDTNQDMLIIRYEEEG